MGEDERDWREQNHADLGALHARVDSIEKGLSTIGTAVRDLSTKIDGVNIAALSARTTNWTGLLSAVGAVAAVVVSVIIGLGAAVITPMNSKMSETASSLAKISEIMVRKDDSLAADNKLGNWLIKFSDRQREDEEKAVRQVDIDDLKYRQRRIEDEYVTGKQLAEMSTRVDERYRGTLDSVNAVIRRLEDRTDAIDGSLVKRPEILALNQSLKEAIESDRRTEDDRISAVSTRLNETEARIGQMFPPGKILDQIWTLLTAMISRGESRLKVAPPGDN